MGAHTHNTFADEWLLVCCAASTVHLSVKRPMPACASPSVPPPSRPSCSGGTYLGAHHCRDGAGRGHKDSPGVDARDVCLLCIHRRLEGALRAAGEPALPCFPPACLPSWRLLPPVSHCLRPGPPPPMHRVQVPPLPPSPCDSCPRLRPSASPPPRPLVPAGPAGVAADCAAASRPRPWQRQCDPLHLGNHHPDQKRQRCLEVGQARLPRLGDRVKGKLGQGLWSACGCLSGEPVGAC